MNFVFVNAFQVLKRLPGRCQAAAVSERGARGPEWGTWQQPPSDKGQPFCAQAQASAPLAGWYSVTLRTRVMLSVSITVKCLSVDF